MAERRMFAKTIIDSDAFLNMPSSSQNLYFHLGMRADDDGVVNNPRTIMRMIGASNDDMNLLISKKFVIVLEETIIIIKHWRINNYIQKDRYVPSKYKELIDNLSLDENNAYTAKNEQCIQGVSKTDTECIQGVSTGKVSIGKDSIVLKENIIKEKNQPFSPKIPQELQELFDFWNSKGIVVHRTINEKMVQLLKKALDLYGQAQIKQAIENYSIVLNDSTYYFSTRWTIGDFVKQTNALPDFLPEGIKWINYQEYLKKSKKVREQDKYEIENSNKPAMEGMEILWLILHKI